MSNPVYCSFCGKDQREAEVMLAGGWPAFICDTCVSDAVDQIARIIAGRRDQDRLVHEALRCTFCQPESLVMPVDGAAP